MGLGSDLYDLIADCDSLGLILIILGYLLMTFIFSRVLNTNHKSFWWMFLKNIALLYCGKKGYGQKGISYYASMLA